MPVLAADLRLLETTNNLGGSSGSVTDGVVFDAFTGDETSAGTTVYACLFVHNNAAETAFAAKVWINSETVHAGTNATIGLGTSAKGSNPTEPTIGNETTAPTGVTFSESASEGAALSIGDLTAGQRKSVWLRLVIGAGTAAKNNYTVQIGIKADTGE